MFEIDGTTIKITRGDKATIEFEFEDGFQFEPGDKIRFSVYKERRYTEDPLIEKNIIITEATNKVQIELTSEDTTIEEVRNRIVDYWYEIEYNDDITVIGYDEDGAKIFRLLPEGREN